MTNRKNNVLYTGVTNNIKRRAYEHRNLTTKGFTQKHKVTKLVYYDCYQDIKLAIQREKQIKAGSRQKKLDLIKKFNENWIDLY